MNEYEKMEQERLDFNKEMTLRLLRLEKSIQEQKTYTQNLLDQSQQKTAPTPTSTPPSPKLTKCEQIGMMSDRELINLTKDPEKFAEMMRGW